MKKRTKIIILLIAAAFLAFGYWVYASFSGSIIRRIVETSAAKKYVAETYPDEPYDVEFSRYDFKSLGYFCIVQSRESEDTHFTVWHNENGFTDNFELYVTGRETTFARLDMALDDYSDELLARIYPHRTTLTLCRISDSVSSSDIAALPLDMPFDIKTFPLPVSVIIWTETENSEPSWEELAERLRELEALLRDELPTAEYYSINLQGKYIEVNGELAPEDRSADVCVFDVPAEIIRNGGLEEYLADVKAGQDAELESIANGEQVK